MSTIICKTCHHKLYLIGHELVVLAMPMFLPELCYFCGAISNEHYVAAVTPKDKEPQSPIKTSFGIIVEHELSRLLRNDGNK